MAQSFLNSAGINTYLNPLTPSQDGALIHAVNMISMPYGAKSKRPGYSAFLGTPDTSQVQSLLAFPNIGNDSTKINLYRASGSALYYSLQGTGDWTLATNGTISNGAHFGAAIGNGGTVMIGGDGIGSTRHTTNGTTFTNTTLAPISEFFADYQGRMYAAGTADTNFYSTTNDATNWNLAGTADSSSFRVPGEGKLQKIFVASDRLIETKSRGKMLQWDGFSQVDMSTNYGPISPYSVAKVENYHFWTNQYGHFGFDGGNPQLLSNPVQRYFYNKQNTGISGTLFPTIPGEAHFYDYFASIGTVTDDFTGRTINNAILNYNFQRNEYLMWQFANNPTSYLSYTDLNSKRQLIFGDASGQCYQLDPTVTTDNGQVINTELVFLFMYGIAALEKKWNWLRLFFNPGCEVNIQAAFADSFTYQHLTWFDITDNSSNPVQNAADGIVEFRFPQGSRSRLMFLRLYESSPDSQWAHYGTDIDAEVQAVK
jgi:hypothetical protein